MSDSVQPQRWQPTRLPRPWDSPGKNTGVGCHFLLQCMKVKCESEVAQLCLIPCDPMDCSLPGSSIHGFFQGRVLEWGAIAFSRENIVRSHQVPQILLKSPVSSLAKSTKITQQWALYFFLIVWSQSTEEKITVTNTKQCIMTEDKCVQLFF